MESGQAPAENEHIAIAALFRTLAHLLFPHAKALKEPTRAAAEKHIRHPSVKPDFEKLKAEERRMVYSVNKRDADQNAATEYSKQAVAFKKEKQWDAAVDSMMEAYEIASKYPENHIHVDYIRLPMYLQAGNRSDEGWHWLVNYSLGILPCNGDRPTARALKLGWRAHVEDKKRLFLEREKNFREAYVARCLNQFFSRSWREVWLVKSEEDVKSEKWNRTGPNGWNAEVAKMDKERMLDNLKNAKRWLSELNIEAISTDLWKTGKRLKITPELNQQCTTFIFNESRQQHNERKACLNAVHVIRGIHEHLSQDP